MIWMGTGWFPPMLTAMLSVSGSDIYVGGLAGFSMGAISGSHATGKATGVIMVGGLVGSNWGAISGSYATGSAAITGSDPGDGGVGGLVGHMESGAISSSYATGSATGNGAVGGLVGLGSRGAIVASYATGSATGSYDGMDVGAQRR